MSLFPTHAWLDGLLEAVWLVDEKSLCILQVNKAAERLAGLPGSDMVGKPVTSLAATPQDHAFWAEPKATLAAGIHSHTSMLRADGVLVPVDRRVTWVNPGDGHAVLMLTMLDRSAQNATEQELETLLSELRATLDSAADGMLVCGLDGRVRAFNQRLAQIWNIPRALLLQRNDAAVHEHLSSMVVDVEDYQARLAAIECEPLLERTDILELHGGMTVERRVVPQLHKGRPVGRVYSFRDITRQTEVQASLRLAARVFDSSLDAIFIADSQHQLMRMNPGCERLVGPCSAAFEGCLAASLFGSGSDASFMEQVLAGWNQKPVPPDAG